MCAGEGLLSRKSSGNVYDDFPCVRVGDYDLPSSMDLRQYLDEMQQVGDWEGDPELPTIPDDEVCFLPTPDGSTTIPVDQARCIEAPHGAPLSS